MAAPSIGPIEQKAAAGPAATLVAGYLAWALITYVPGLKDAFPADIQAQLPVMFAFVISAIAAYFAPHTSRPDLSRAPAAGVMVTPPPATATASSSYPHGRHE